MEVDGQDARPEPLEERRKRLSKLLSCSNKKMRDGIQVSEAITGDGAAIFRHACWMDLEGTPSKRIDSRYVSGRIRAWLDEEPALRAAVKASVTGAGRPRINWCRSCRSVHEQRLDPRLCR